MSGRRLEFCGKCGVRFDEANSIPKRYTRNGVLRTTRRCKNCSGWGKAKARSQRSYRKKVKVLRTYRETGSLSQAAAGGGVSTTRAHQMLAAAKAIRRPLAVFPVSLIRKALALYASGLSCREAAARIARETKYRPTDVWIFRHAKRAGILRSHSRAMQLAAATHYKKDFDAIRRAARKLAEKNLWSVTHISKVLGVSSHVVVAALPRSLRCGRSLANERRAWQAFLPDVELRRERRDRVVFLRQRGYSYAEIMAATGLSKPTVTRYLQLAGMTARTRAGRQI